MVLYFGCTRFEIILPGELPVTNEIYSRFKTPVLPSAYVAEVKICYENSVEFQSLVKKRGEYFHNGKFSVCRSNQSEIRFYHVPNTNQEEVYAYNVGESSKVELILDGESLYIKNHVFFPFLNFIQIERVLLEHLAIILHSCFLSYRNEAILFTAPSGTGKTTQGKLWEKLYDDSRILNGDRCLIQKYKDRFYGCGYFVHGSAVECENQAVPLKCIVIVRQSHIDEVVELSIPQKIQWIYSETTVNKWNSTSISKTLDLLLEMVMQVKVIQLNCTMQDSAAYILHKYLYGD